MNFNTYPTKRDWLCHGDVIVLIQQPYAGKHAVVTDAGTNSTGWKVKARILLDDGTDDPKQPSIEFYTIDTEHNKRFELEVVDKMYLYSEKEGKYSRRVKDNPSFSSFAYSYEDKLPTDNPLRSMKYWGEPGGKNLSIIACLEWALLHLTNENNNLPCDENAVSMAAIRTALQHQIMRRERRQKQGVLGKMEPHVSNDEEK